MSDGLKIPSGFPAFRQSNLEAAKCLFRFNELYLRGKKEPLSEYAGRGQEFARLHSEYVNWLVKSDQEHDWAYAEQLAAGPGIGQEAASLFRSWFPRAIINPKTVYGTEVKLTLDADLKPCSPGGHAISGDFDMLSIEGDTAIIDDQKSHFAPFEPDTIQSVMYPWLLRKTMPHLKTIVFRLQFIRWHIEKEREFDAAEIDRLEREEILPMIQRVLDANEKNEWPASPSKACSYCSLDCPLLSQFTAEQLGRIEDPRAAAETLYVLEKRAERLKEQLKAYAVEYGPISLGSGYQLGFQRRTTQQYDVKRTVELNADHGFPLYRGLSVDNQEIKKISKKYPEFKSELEKTKKDASTTTFGFRTEEE